MDENDLTEQDTALMYLIVNRADNRFVESINLEVSDDA